MRGPCERGADAIVDELGGLKVVPKPEARASLKEKRQSTLVIVVDCSRSGSGRRRRGR